MKDASTRTLKLAGFVLVALFGLAPAAQAQNREKQAQDREKYVIHAKAGGINSVSGDVRVLRKGSDAERELTTSEDLRAGDIVRTGASGRVEVLLNPGSYMRAGENASVELVDASLETLLVRLTGGSLVVEATGGDGVELAIGVKTPQAEAMIIKGGIYRFNVLPDGATEVLVRKGRVQLGQEEIKGDRKVSIKGGQTEVAKLDKKQQDELDLWSKERAKELARANNRLQTRPLETAFNRFNWYSLDARGRRSPYSLGFWIYDASRGGYCFLPSGWSAFASPYGFWYDTGFGRDWRLDGWRLNDARRLPGNNSPSSRRAGGDPTPVRAPQPAPRPTGGQSPRPPVERGPRREYTIQ